MPRKFAERELRSALLLLDALPEFAEALRPRRLPATSGTTMLEWRPYGVVLGLHSANSPIWVPTVVSMSALVAGNARRLPALEPRGRARQHAVLRALARRVARGCPDDRRPATAPASGRCWSAAGIDAIVAHASTGTCKAHLAALAAAYADGAGAAALHPRGIGQRCADGAARRRYRARPQRRSRSARSRTPVSCAFRPNASSCTGRLWRELRPALVDAVAAHRDRRPGGPGHRPRRPTSTRTSRPPRLRSPRRSPPVVGWSWAGRRHPVRPCRGWCCCRATRLRAARPLAPGDLRADPGVALVDDAADAIALAERHAVRDRRVGLRRVGPRITGASADAVRVARLLINESPLYQDPHLVVGGVRDSGYGGARPKLEQLVYARRVHTA